ncbi:MAG: hypothetical protein ABH872_07590 [Candidatus Omnitrophota bacterium]
MNLFKKFGIESQADKIDFFILSILGFLFLGYSTYYKSFSEIRIEPGFLNFPVFIGEISLFICVVLTIFKWRLINKKFTKAYALLIPYLLFILIKALWGYSQFGPFALRHSAMFYYPLFALIAYDVYKSKFVNVNMLLFLFFALALFGIGTYYNFTYLILMVLFLVIGRSKIIKISGFIILCIFFKPFLLVDCPRTQIIGHVAGFGSLLFLALLILKLKNRYKAAIIGICLLISVTVLIRFKDNSSIQSLTTPKTLMSSIKDWDKLIEQRRADYKKMDIPVRLYNPESKENLPELPRVMRFAKETMQEWNENREKEAARALRNIETSEILIKLPSDLSRREKIIEYIIAKKGIIDKVEPKEVEPKEVEPVILNQHKSSFNKEVLLTPEEMAIDYKIPDKESNFIVALPEDKVLREQIVNFIQKQEIKKEFQTAQVVIPPVVEPELSAEAEEVRIDLGLGQRHNTTVFRLFTWRDMIRELIKEKAVFGFSFGKPLRSESVEIMRMAYGEWTRDGWIAAHNSYLEVIYRTGIIGIILIINLFAVLFRMVKVFIKEKSFTGISLVSIIVYWLTVALFYVTFGMPYSAVFFWSLFGATMAYSRQLRERNRKVTG